MNGLFLKVMSLTPEQRRRIYNIAIAVAPILLLMKVVTPEQIDPVLNLLSAVLGVGVPVVAKSFVPTAFKEPDQ
ncbi:hypothetical protein PXH69_24120 [Rhodococcus qingshengii]|uniref:Holin n=1 Tax=Rhodococcus qingshengii TaxID=334542 RepID=A0AAW6LNC6_RHOSG|nr:hypothetical protein [Rhodococcus qingshengii]MDE8648069.1 hypothetical protein [Rhodococcus qingshengii]